MVLLALAGCGDPQLQTRDTSVTTQCRLGPRTCDPQIGCPDDNGCNWCGCSIMGTPTGGEAACNQVGCIQQTDAGTSTRPSTRCTTRAECAAGETCVFDPGCPGTQGRCTLPSACSSVGTGAPPASGAPVKVCGCDGQTVSVTHSCGIEQPYHHFGACP